MGLAVQEQCEEAEHGCKYGLLQRYLLGISEEDSHSTSVPMELHTDANDLVVASRSLILPKGIEKRRRGDVADIQQLQALGFLRPLMKITGKTNPTNAGTKKLSFEDPTMHRMRNLYQHGKYTPDLG